MNLQYIIDEIQKRESTKETFFNQLISECKLVIGKLTPFKDTNLSFRPTLPTGVIGRRLSDKIIHLENTIDTMSKTSKTAISDLEIIEKALKLVIEHLKNYKSTFDLDEEIETPKSLDILKSEFIILASLQNNLKNSYVQFCLEQLKTKLSETIDPIKKNEIKQTFDIYILMEKNMPYDSIARLKNLNEEYGNILTPSDIAKEYKRSDERLMQAKYEFENASVEREKFKEVAKHLTHLQKCENKSKTYLAEIDKHIKKLEFLDEDSRHEIQELISSYKDAHKIVQEEIDKIQTYISAEYGITDVDGYDIKSKSIQQRIAGREVEISMLERRIVLLELVISDVHECRRRATIEKEQQNSRSEKPPIPPVFQPKLANTDDSSEPENITNVIDNTSNDIDNTSNDIDNENDLPQLYDDEDDETIVMIKSDNLKDTLSAIVDPDEIDDSFFGPENNEGQNNENNFNEENSSEIIEQPQLHQQYLEPPEPQEPQWSLEPQELQEHQEPQSVQQSDSEEISNIQPDSILDTPTNPTLEILPEIPINIPLVTFSEIPTNIPDVTFPEIPAKIPEVTFSEIPINIPEVTFSEIPITPPVKAVIQTHFNQDIIPSIDNDNFYSFYDGADDNSNLAENSNDFDDSDDSDDSNVSNNSFNAANSDNSNNYEEFEMSNDFDIPDDSNNSDTPDEFKISDEFDIPDESDDSFDFETTEDSEDYEDPDDLQKFYDADDFDVSIDKIPPFKSADNNTQTKANNLALDLESFEEKKLLVNLNIAKNEDSYSKEVDDDDDEDDDEDDEDEEDEDDEDDSNNFEHVFELMDENSSSNSKSSSSKTGASTSSQKDAELFKFEDLYEAIDADTNPNAKPAGIDPKDMKFEDLYEPLDPVIEKKSSSKNKKNTNKK